MREEAEIALPRQRPGVWKLNMDGDRYDNGTIQVSDRLG